MNEQEIDEALKAIKVDDASKLIELSGIDIKGRTEGQPHRPLIDAVMSKIMSKIEQGAYEYFLSKIEEPEYKSSVLDFMCYSSQSDDIKNMIEQKEKWWDNIPMPERYLSGLIIATGDQDYMKEFLEDDERRSDFEEQPGYIVEIIKGTNDPEYEKKCIEERDKFNINNDGITNLVEHINDSSYTEEIISRRDEFGFSQEETVAIIAGAKSDFIKGIIEDDRKVKEFELSLNQMIDLIIAAGKDYITEVVTSKEKLEKFGINKTELGRLILATKDPKYINAYLKQNGKKEQEKGTDRKIKLPKNMTIGTEIESEGIASREILGLSKVFEKGWECKQDLSTDDGVEVVSPILKGDTEKTTEVIKRVCSKLQVFGQTVSERCGGHVHIGGDYLTIPESWENIQDLWGNTELVMFLISNKAGELPREGVAKYARPLSKEQEEKLSRDTIQLRTMDDLRQLAMDSQKNENGEVDRYHGINYKNLGKGMSGTIEFRLANGTIDEETWIENINLFGGIVRASEELALIEQKTAEDRTAEEQQRLDDFESLKYLGTSDKDKLEILLSLAIAEEDRDIYRERYNANSVLLEQHPELYEALTEQVSTNPTDVKKARRWQEMKRTYPELQKNPELYEENPDLYPIIDPVISTDKASDTDVVRASKIFESELRRDFEERQNDGNKEWRDD